MYAIRSYYGRLVARGFAVDEHVDDTQLDVDADLLEAPLYDLAGLAAQVVPLVGDDGEGERPAILVQLPVAIVSYNFV